MERPEVYRLIDGEREYQQARGLPDERLLWEWSDSIYDYGCDLQTGIINRDEAKSLHALRKIAALAVAALEQYGCEPRAKE